MKRRYIAILLSMAMVLSLISTVQAQPRSGSDSQEASIPAVQATGENDVAVIVAIEEYAFLPNVPGAIENGLEWKSFLERGLGVESTYFLTDQQATHEEIEQMAKESASEIGEEGTLWFVFIGHGAPAKQGGEAAFVGMDARQSVEGIQRRSLSRADLLTALQSGEQEQTVMVLDACFSGRTNDGESLAPGTQPVVPVSAVPEVASSTVMLTAASADQYAGPLADKERPAFSYLLLDGVRRLADDDDGIVTAELALSYARQKLRRIPGRTQVPELVGTADLKLARGLADAASETGETTQQSSSTKGSDYSPEKVEDANDDQADGDKEEQSPSSETAVQAEFKALSFEDGDDRALEYLHGVCGDEATIKSEYGRKSALCPTGCPQDSPNPEGPPTAQAVYVGDFNGNGTNEAILVVSRCNRSRADGQFGVFILRESGDSWKKSSYQHGVDARFCEVSGTSDQGLLLCVTSFVGQGINEMTLVVRAMDTQNQKLSAQRLMNYEELYDHRHACGMASITLEGEFRSKATTKVIDDLTGDGKMELAVGITRDYGVPRTGFDPSAHDDPLGEPCKEKNYTFGQRRELRIWTLDNGEFSRAPKLEKDVNHPELRKYQ